MKIKPTECEKIFARSDQQGISLQNIQFIQPDSKKKKKKKEKKDLIKNEWEI